MKFIYPVAGFSYLSSGSIYLLCPVFFSLKEAVIVDQNFKKQSIMLTASAFHFLPF